MGNETYFVPNTIHNFRVISRTKLK